MIRQFLVRTSTVILSVLLSSWAFTANAQADTTKSLLWEITGNELTIPSYLYGTIHMIGEDDYFLTAATQRAFDASQRVTFEIDMEDMNNLAAMMPLMMKAFMTDDITLSDLLTEAEYSEVKAHFQDMGIPMMFLDRIKPMFLSMMGQGDMFAQTEDGMESVKSYEVEFMHMAQERELPIDGLETAEYQMSVIADSIPYDVQARMLMESIRAGTDTSGDNQIEEMVRLYKAQDIEAMQTMMAEDDSMAEYGDLLLVTRNRNWIPVMATMMEEQPTFFAVGAGHLGGQEGVIELLRQEGYILKPLY